MNVDTIIFFEKWRSPLKILNGIEGFDRFSLIGACKFFGTLFDTLDRKEGIFAPPPPQVES